MDPNRETVVPVVLRGHAQNRRVLAFEHPLAGNQFIKGGLEKGETPEVGAARELFEESGLHSEAAQLMRTFPKDHNGPKWHLVSCQVTSPADNWRHFCRDDGGHWFRFFWHPINRDLGQITLPFFQRILVQIRICNEGQ